MKDRSLRLALALVALVSLLGCKKKSEPSEGVRAAQSSSKASAGSVVPVSANAGDHVIQSKDEVCSLLTTAEVAEELKKPMQPARQRAISLGAPTECVYQAGEGADAEGVVVRLYFQPDSLQVQAGFAHATFEQCGHESQERVESLGDQAVLCGKLLVRKGDVFFVLSRLNGDPAVPWADSAKRLASKAVARLP